MINGAIKILVVDDHPIIYQGLLQMISDEAGITIVGSAKSYDEALELIEKVKPNLMIIDIGLKSDKNGIDLVKEITEKWPDISTMVLSMHDEEIYAERAFNAGAKGYVSKSDFTEKIVDAIESVKRGELYFEHEQGSLATLDKDHKQMMMLKRLTDRELAVFEMVGQGLKNEEIALKLDLKEKTIFSHKLRIKNKLKLDSSADLLRIAVKWCTENCV